ncbi:MAG: type VI secretion system ImpA family N-terminal domain-containing protein [Chitinispirillia bacterium]|nr:type VI secretion system ImpA family N-terminal domain-containing protein [Chitinispirillia bacterium]MCL2242259.1 type VI secretion system ImpA family N-terminal domain-containing protein [Chitinispirillia bacterium]
MSEFLSRLAAPVAGDDPFGVDVNHDPGYERLKGEIGKLGDIDVDLVESLSIKVLTERSKDLRAAAWLAYAVLRKGDLGRLADVVGLLVDYCADSFEQVFPRRESAKLAALRWLSEPRFTSQCPKADAAGSDGLHIAKMKEALVRLKPVLEKRFPSTGAPFPSLLYKRVIEWERAVSALAEDSAGVGEDGGQGVDLSADRTINPAGGPGESTRMGDLPPVRASDKTNGQATVVLKLTHNEYKEIVGCIGKLDTLLKKFG